MFTEIIAPETVAPSRAKYSRYDVVEALRRFAAQNNLTIQIIFEEGRYFKAELPTTALVTEPGFVVKGPGFSMPDPRDRPFGQSRDCLESDVYEKRQSEYYLACQISERTLLLSRLPPITLHVPDLRTCAKRIIKDPNPPAYVLNALRAFAKQNNLTIQLRYSEYGYFLAELLAATKLLDIAYKNEDAKDEDAPILGISRGCDAANDAMREDAEYDLARKVSEKKLLLSRIPRVELQVPDLVTCAIDDQEESRKELAAEELSCLPK